MKTTFEINAFTATLAKTSKVNSIHILNNGVWQIPIYQRPYSWGEHEVGRFLRDLNDNFKDESGVSNPMFIGTMQISEEKNGLRDIIDGQQRLTTFLLMFRAINLKIEQQESIIPTNWLSSKVNRGEAQASMEVALTGNVLDLLKVVEVNTYAKNLIFIDNFLNENLAVEDLIDFKKYISQNVYFVCIETKATLSKTLQIFESINATGMDLNAGDLFKVNFYEYLTSKQNYQEVVFEKISDLYAQIDRANKHNGEIITSIIDILTLYKMILISKYDLPNSLYFMGTETFYERLFDTLLNNVSDEDFGLKANNVVLDIKELERLIDSRVFWHFSLGATLEEDMSYYFIFWSRYNRYWRTILTFEFAYQGALSQELLATYKIQFAKLLFIYSVKFGKAVNECHNFVRKLLKSMFTETNPQMIVENINQEISRHKSSDDEKGWFEIKMNEPIAGIPKAKYLLCRMGAMLSEDYTTANVAIIEKLRSVLCFNEIDIEHIQSYNHEDLALREQIWKEWKDEINSLGNLVVLEREINRNIKNSAFASKKVAYSKSQFSIVEQVKPASEDWTLQDALIRKETEINRILNYIFG